MLISPWLPRAAVLFAVTTLVSAFAPGQPWSAVFDARTDSDGPVSESDGPNHNYLNSGWVQAAGSGLAPVRVFGGEIRSNGKMWLRLHFGTAVLSGERGDANASYLVLTSALDGASQTLWAEDLEAWSMSSAYFNGDCVFVELYASPRSGPSMVQVNGIEAGEPGWLDRSLCGPTDDRFASGDPRTGRVLPSQCTAWLVSDLTSGLLSAGHCAIGARSVVQFNVPLSTVGGSMVHPDPSDQYPVDPASKQTQTGSIGVGNDWMFFGIHANTTTGRTALEAQGATHHLASSLPPNDERQVAVVGYGQVSQPRPLELNYAQTAGMGAFRGSTTNIVKYMADTTGGNSGAPVLDLTTGLAIGIHTNGVCNSNGYNRGTAATKTSLQTALANPVGRAADTGGVLISFPQGRPAEVSVGGGTTLEVRVRASATRTPSDGSVMLHVFDGQAWSAIPMEQLGVETYRATFPAVSACVARVSYYISVVNTVGQTDTSPAGERLFEAEVARPSEILGSFSFELGGGWQVSSDASLREGAWKIAEPPSVARLGPKKDFDASGRCLLTGPGVREDVDGGSTSVVSPVVRVCPQSDAHLSMALWHASTTPDDEGLMVEVSVDRGASWTEIDRAKNTDGWEMRVYRLRDFVTLGSDLVVRFTTSDSDAQGWPEGGIVESAVDRVKIFEPLCLGSSSHYGNVPGEFGDAEFRAFLNSVTTGDLAADATGDGAIDVNDLLSLLRGPQGACR